ncbi:uncharacterized protein [Diadema setosum]|uniref:uncharacterized protein n=1 Tax=Diadema setosum TaxID=31175 RepID=UPI003B3BBC53
MINDPKESISRSLHDVSHRDSTKDITEDIAQCQDTTADAKKEHYMDMTGNVKKKKGDVEKFVECKDSSAAENDVDEHGYLISNVGPRGATNSEPPENFKSEKTGDNLDSVQAMDKGLTIHSRPADGGCGVTYEEIPSTSDQSEPIREPPRDREYSTIERNNDSLATGLNNALYSVSIYSRKEREEHDLDENGYLLLEA